MGIHFIDSWKYYLKMSFKALKLVQMHLQFCRP